MWQKIALKFQLTNCWPAIMVYCAASLLKASTRYATNAR